MQSNTISVTPVPIGTTQDQIKSIFHAFSVYNVHIDFPTAYVSFHDQGDFENLEIQFDNYEVAQLNNAKIDKVEFNWSSIKKENTSPDKKSDSNSSDKHQDLMAADLDHLVIVENCDQVFLKNLSEDNIRQLFKNFHSINRILKRRKDVIIEFNDLGDMEQLQNRFPGFNVAEMGWNSTIEKVEPSKISASEFVQEWSKLHTKESMITQATTRLSYGEQKPSSGQLPRQKKFDFGSYESKPSSQQVLHQDIIPPFDKKTSMEVNFLNEQSKLGYKEQKPQHEPIHEATTHQQLDYTTEIKIKDDFEDEDRFGFEAAEKTEKQKLAEIERKKQEDQRKENERKAQEQKKRKQEQEKERERIRKEQEQRERKRREEQKRERERKQQEQRKRKQEQQLQQKIQKEQEQTLKRQTEQAKRLQEQRLIHLAEQQAKQRRQQQRLEQQLKEKLETQRLKYQKEEEQKRKQQLGYHEPPTESENVIKEAEFIKKAGKTIEEELGYAVNKAKAESANLVNAGLEILRGHDDNKQKIGYNESTAEQSFQAKKQDINLGYDKPEIREKKAQELGFDKKQLKEVGFDILNSSMEFLKSSYSKVQQTFGTIAKDISHPSELGYEKWTVRPDAHVEKPVVGKQPRVLKTLVTMTLLIWVIFLLMQDTSSTSEVVSHEHEIGIQTVEATQQEVPVSTSENI